MMTKLLQLYLLINFSGQKIGNPWNVKDGLINILLMEISFVLSGTFIGFVLLAGLRSKFLILSLLLGFIFSLWRFLKKKLELSIDFLHLELIYNKLSRLIKIAYFIFSILFLIVSVFTMIFLIKWILILK